MPEEHQVVDVLAGDIGPGVEGWSVIALRPGGIRWQTAIPQAAFEWRAAEYGLTDPAEILDVILHECYLEVPEPVRQQSVKAPVVAASKPGPDPYGPTLREAVSTSAARDAHRRRVAAVKERRVQVTDPEGLLSHIHRNHGMDSGRVREKREAVDIRRWQSVYGDLPVQPRSMALEVPRA
ncbi:hypothetical protein AB0M61_01515 [Streptomyces sp. NPDC051642]|uniref:hypothetical protein n=1 Tax=Streptomyces sp. NPDC051642 TaxID=3154646 RepID=UPI003432A397